MIEWYYMFIGILIGIFITMFWLWQGGYKKLNLTHKQKKANK